jgi:hypothetical protein
VHRVKEGSEVSCTHRTFKNAQNVLAHIGCVDTHKTCRHIQEENLISSKCFLGARVAGGVEPMGPLYIRVTMYVDVTTRALERP